MAISLPNKKKRGICKPFILCIATESRPPVKVSRSAITWIDEKKKTKEFTHHIKSDVLHRHMKSVGQITSCTLVYHTEILVPYSQAAKLSVELTVDEKVWRANRFKQPRSLRYALPESKLQVCSVYVIPVERQHGMVAKRK